MLAEEVPAEEILVEGVLCGRGLAEEVLAEEMFSEGVLCGSGLRKRSVPFASCLVLVFYFLGVFWQSGACRIPYEMAHAVFSWCAGLCGYIGAGVYLSRRCVLANLDEVLESYGELRTVMESCEKLQQNYKLIIGLCKRYGEVMKSPSQEDL